MRLVKLGVDEVLDAALDIVIVRRVLRKVLEDVENVLLILKVVLGNIIAVQYQLVKIVGLKFNIRI